jgi:hypothetical protein
MSRAVCSLQFTWNWLANERRPRNADGDREKKVALPIDHLFSGHTFATKLN